jgi:PAS domain S-box-containing protein
MSTRINFSNAIQDHNEWMLKIRRFLDNELELDVNEIESHESTMIGSWFYSEGKSNFGHLEEIQEFEVKNIKLHRLASEIYGLKKSNKIKLAEDYYKDLLYTSSSIIESLNVAQQNINAVIDEPIEMNESVEIDENNDIAVAWDKSLKLTIETDEKHNILFVNENFSTVSGIEDIDCIGKPHNFTFHPDMPQLIDKLWKEAIAKKNNRITIIKHIAASGKYFWVVANYKINSSADNKVESINSFQTGLNKDIITNHIEPLYVKLKSIENTFNVAASEKYFNGFLKERKRTYDEFILNLLMTGLDTVKSKEQTSIFGRIAKSFNI